jgi:hypothetical protein
MTYSSGKSWKLPLSRKPEDQKAQARKLDLLEPHFYKNFWTHEGQQLTNRNYGPLHAMPHQGQRQAEIPLATLRRLLNYANQAAALIHQSQVNPGSGLGIDPVPQLSLPDLGGFHDTRES